MLNAIVLLQFAEGAGLKRVLDLLRGSIQADKTKRTRMAAKCKGVSEETTTDMHRLKEMRWLPRVRSSFRLSM